jgi:transcriptional regulator of met regulon
MINQNKKSEKKVEYYSVKIPKEKIETLIDTLEKRNIKARSNAEAVNILIDNFLLNSYSKVQKNIGEVE